MLLLFPFSIIRNLLYFFRKILTECFELRSKILIYYKRETDCFEFKVYSVLT